jgi:hypothetical protein
MPSSLKPALRALLGASAAALAFTAPAAAAPVAGPEIPATDASRSTCERPALGTPYAAIGDERTYVAAPGGSFEDASGAGWQLSPTASIEAGRSGGELVLPMGASAVSPRMCIDLDYPHLRFSQNATGRHAGAVAIKVDVIYPDVEAADWVGVAQVSPVAGAPVGAGWRVSPDVALRPELGGQDWGARDVALRFTAVPKADGPARRRSAGAEVRVDDVFIDPRARF